MKIKQLKLNNIGSYEGEHTFSFSIDNIQKNIILIGGRNGAGKTTLFDSIRLCLYGYTLFGYRQNSQAYIGKVKRLINDKAKKESITVAGIYMEILIEDGFSNNTFSINRTWKIEGKQIKEEYAVYKDGVLLDAEEQADFDSYLLQTIPPALLNFHFFNGENISELIFNDMGGQSFRSAFMQICGLDTFDLLEEQLRNNIRIQKDKKNIALQNNYEEAKKNFAEATSKYDTVISQIAHVQSEIDALEDKLVMLDKTMTQYGGIASSSLTKFQETLKEEESKRDESRHFLKDAANNIIPFIILKNELDALKNQILIETKLQKNRVFKEKLLTDTAQKNIGERIKPFLKDTTAKIPNDFFLTLYEAVREDCSDERKEILKLSESENMNLQVKIQEYSNFDIQRIIKAEKDIDVSLKKVKKLRTKMETKEGLDAEKYYTQKNDILNSLEGKRQELFEKKSAMLQQQEVLKDLKSCFDNAYHEFKASLKAQSVTNMAARTLLAISDLKQRLYSKYVTLVEEKFSVYFNKLISKTDLLDGIYISSLFEVIAYRQSDIDIKVILQRITDLGEDYVKSEIGERAFEQVQNNNPDNGIVSVPLKIEKHFSAGEQQIFVMALYQALASIRTAELPFIIDTPLARIDSEHRRNILLHFFAELPGQVMILSTDEEVDNAGVELLKERISDVYLIEHQGNGVSKAVKDTYFKEATN